MSMNFNDFSKLAKDQTSATDDGDSSSSSSANDAETIYYLETPTPHTYDNLRLGAVLPTRLHHLSSHAQLRRRVSSRSVQFPFPSLNPTTPNQAVKY
jgi:hypothetical protein